MCIVAAKYFDDLGWVGVKNRDRNYKPVVRIRQSYRNGVERMYIWDEKTKYTEGLNEYGICILSAAVAVKKDEKEGVKNNTREQQTFFSPDGKKIRRALLEKTLDDAVQNVIDAELNGNTLLFTEERCVLLEGDTYDGKYKYEMKEIDKDSDVARTNHGVMITSGYKKDDEDPQKQKAFESSKSRLEITRKNMKEITDGPALIDAISTKTEDDPQMNPIRIETKHGKSILQTTGQLMIIPKERCLYYRPVWCNMQFNFDKLDSKKSNTYFQILSSRKLFKESVSKFDQFILERNLQYVESD